MVNKYKKYFLAFKDIWRQNIWRMGTDILGWNINLIKMHDFGTFELEN
jgi:hypothetical protein